MNIEALKEAHDLSLDGRDFAARQIILDVIADLEKKEPAGYADKIAFESAMKVGKGCDVWPVKGDYEARTGRALIALYTSPPAQQEPVAWMSDVGSVASAHEKKMGYVLESAFTTPLYTSPPAQRKPLTDEEIIASNYPDGEENGPTIAAPDFELICFARQIEAKLKEKNNG